MGLAESNHEPNKSEDVLMRLEPAPIEPRGDVILVIRIIIPALGLEKLIAGTDHRGSIREEQQAHEVFRLALPQLQNLIRQAVIPFPAAVPTVVLGGAIFIVVSVGPIPFVIVGDEIIEREPIVTGDVIYALIGMVGVHAIIRKQIVAPV